MDAGGARDCHQQRPRHQRRWPRWAHRGRGLWRAQRDMRAVVTDEKTLGCLAGLPPLGCLQRCPMTDARIAQCLGSRTISSVATREVPTDTTASATARKS
jgi:hypothetical protein